MGQIFPVRVKKREEERGHCVLDVRESGGGRKGRVTPSLTGETDQHSIGQCE